MLEAGGNFSRLAEWPYNFEDSESQVEALMYLVSERPWRPSDLGQDRMPGQCGIVGEITKRACAPSSPSL